jgi:hypothetical protein
VPVLTPHLAGDVGVLLERVGGDQQQVSISPARSRRLARSVESRERDAAPATSRSLFSTSDGIGPPSTRGAK